MKIKRKYQITEFCHHFLSEYIAEGSCCVDATCGNGYDTVFLCKAVGNSGKVYAFDIQQLAVQNTKNRLEKEGLAQRAVVIREGHENMSRFLSEKTADVIMFNFGYLPGGSHSASTRPDTSLAAVKSGLSLLKPGGVMSLCIYSGGDTGYEEKEVLLSFLQDLDSSQWLVIMCSYFNRKNDPPLPVFVIKLI